MFCCFSFILLQHGFRGGEPDFGEEIMACGNLLNTHTILNSGHGLCTECFIFSVEGPECNSVYCPSLSHSAISGARQTCPHEGEKGKKKPELYSCWSFFPGEPTHVREEQHLADIFWNELKIESKA